MAREYPCLREYYYLHLHELPASQPNYHQYDIGHDANPNPASTAYEVTNGAGASAVEAGALDSAHQHQLLDDARHDHDLRKRKNYHFLENFEMPSTMPQLVQQMPTPTRSTRKRSLSSYGGGSAYDDDGADDARSTRTQPDKKQNHSEVEKRRRDKMNTYISELSSMIPMCSAMSRKLDKLTVLRMAVQHLRTVRGSLNACPLTARPRPAFLSERELNELILEAARGCFVLVVGCDRGRILYISESVSTMLHYENSELLGQSLFDILHPKDVTKVKEQLSSSDLSPRERLIDAKTMLPVKAEVCTGSSRFCTGARRSFFCRIKCKSMTEPIATSIKEESEPVAKLHKKQPGEKKYCVVQCTGYLKSWAPTDMCEDSSGGAEGSVGAEGSAGEGGDESEAYTVSCLVAVGRALSDFNPLPDKQTPPTSYRFVSRHATDGKFLFVDQRVTPALGFLPQELLGTSLYEYIPPPELGAVARAHKDALLHRDALHTPPYYFRGKDGTHVRLQTHFKPFRNPWTKDVECLVANNTVLCAAQLPPPGAERAAYDVIEQKADAEMHTLIDSQVESHKIGSAIAEEVLRRSSPEFSPELPTDLLQDPFFSQQPSLVDNILSDTGTEFIEAAGEEAEGPAVQGQPSGAPLSGDGEAALAVIMSLLEADAGLGGPVNFSGLPWPLP